jgi:hypothetical protein
MHGNLEKSAEVVGRLFHRKIFSGVNTTTMQVEFIRVASSTSRIQSVGKSEHVMCSPVD